jgi:L-ascorbate metabolism protein UlaG (beta-lactamase superfamily)
MTLSRWIVRLVFVRRFFVRLFLATIAPSFVASLALAQAVAPLNPEMMQACPGLVAGNGARVMGAAWHSDAPNVAAVHTFKFAALNSEQVRLTFLGHATFLIESTQLVRIATDYNDYIRPPVLPDIITMNHAHDTHYTDRPDPAIKYVLRGWGESPNQPAIWDLKYRDVRVRNVPTNIRSFYGSTTTERYGNSIFIFEIANLCIAHLGHLHHTLTQHQLNEIGRVDVVLAPVDGSYTLDLDGMIEVLTALKAPLIVPMHYYGQYILDRFLDRARKLWDVETAEIPSVVISKAMLPAAPKVVVLPGQF